jgi:HEAT repeat protein/predicted transcriptional regulator
MSTRPIDALVEEIAAQIKRERIALFVGNDLAPASKCSTRALTQYLNERMGHTEHLPLPKVAQELETKQGRHELVRLLRELLDTQGVERPEAYQLIVGLPVKILITTAYDDLLEQAIRGAGKRYDIVINEEDVSFGGLATPTLLKICGDLQQPQSLVVTQYDHWDYIHDHPSIVNALQFYAARFSILFMGYTLDAPSFELIWHSIYRNLGQFNRRAYFVTPDVEEYEYLSWGGRNVELIPLSSEDFLRQLVQRLPEEAEVQPETQRRHRLERERPYQFLDYYDPDDADIFFGRDEETAKLAERVLSHGLSVLVGRSGVGKTSLVRAGLMPVLEEEGFVPLYLRTSPDPLESLRRELGSLSHGATTVSPDGDLYTLLSALEPQMGEGLVILLDQFEEFFIITGERQRERFVHQLEEVLNSERVNVRFLLCVRQDYFAHLLKIADMGLRDLHRYAYLLEGLTESSARDAIVKPAELFEVSYDEQLLDTLIGDLAEAERIWPAQMQILCSTLYESAGGRGSTVTLELYEELGGAEGILAQYLEDVLETKFPASERDAALQVLRALVTSEGTKEAMPLEHLARQLVLPPSQVESLLKQLIEHRLVRRVDRREDGFEYELVHDYLANTLMAGISDLELQTRALHEVLGREMSDWQRFRTPIGAEKLRKLAADPRLPERISAQEMGLILWSSITNKIMRSYWVFQWWDAAPDYQNAALEFMFDHGETLESSSFEWVSRFVILAAHTFGSDLILDNVMDWLISQVSDGFDRPNWATVCNVLFSLGSPEGVERGLQLMIPSLSSPSGSYSSSELSLDIVSAVLVEHKEAVLKLIAEDSPVAQAFGIFVLSEGWESLSDTERALVTQKARELIDRASDIDSESGRAAIARAWAKLGMVETAPVIAGFLEGVFLNDAARDSLQEALASFEPAELAKAFLEAVGEAGERSQEEEEELFAFTADNLNERLNNLAVVVAERYLELKALYPELRDELLPLLLEVGQSSSWETQQVRPRVIKALAAFDDAPEARIAIEAALRDTDEDIRQVALQAYVEMDAPDANEKLVEAMRDMEEDVRLAAVHAVPEGCEDETLVEALGGLAKDPEDHIRIAALEALGRCVPSDTVISAVVRFLETTDDDVLKAAIGVIQRIGIDACLPALAQEMLVNSPSLPGIMAALAVSTPAPLEDDILREALAQGLVRGARSTSREVRGFAVMVAGLYRVHEFAPLALEFLRDSDSDVQEAATRALQAFDIHEVLEHLVLEMEKPDFESVADPIVRILLARYEALSDEQQALLRDKILWLVEERGYGIADRDILLLLEKLIGIDKTGELAATLGAVSAFEDMVTAQSRELPLIRLADMYILSLGSPHSDEAAMWHHATALKWLLERKQELPEDQVRRAQDAARACIDGIHSDGSSERSRAVLAMELIADESLVLLLLEQLPSLLFGDASVEPELVFEALGRAGTEQLTAQGEEFINLPDRQSHLAGLLVLTRCYDELEPYLRERFDELYADLAAGFEAMEDDERAVILGLSLRLSTEAALGFLVDLLLSEEPEVSSWQWRIRSSLEEETESPLVPVLVARLPSYDYLQKLPLLSVISAKFDGLSEDHRTEFASALLEVVPVLEMTGEESEEARREVMKLIRLDGSSVFYPHLVKGLGDDDFMVSSEAEEAIKEIDFQDLAPALISEMEEISAQRLKLIDKIIEIINGHFQELSPDQVALLRNAAVPLLRYLDVDFSESIRLPLSQDMLKQFFKLLNGDYSILLSLAEAGGILPSLSSQEVLPEDVGVLIAQKELSDGWLSEDKRFPAIASLIRTGGVGAARALSTEFNKALRERSGILGSTYRQHAIACAAGIMCLSPEVVDQATYEKAQTEWNRAFVSIHTDERQALIKALTALPISNRVARLTEMLEDLDSGVRAAAARALAQVGDQTSIEPMTALLEDNVMLTEGEGIERVDDKLVELITVSGAAQLALYELKTRLGLPAELPEG